MMGGKTLNFDSMTFMNLLHRGGPVDSYTPTVAAYFRTRDFRAPNALPAPLREDGASKTHTWGQINRLLVGQFPTPPENWINFVRFPASSYS